MTKVFRDEDGVEWQIAGRWSTDECVVIQKKPKTPEKSEMWQWIGNEYPYIADDHTRYGFRNGIVEGCRKMLEVAYSYDTNCSNRVRDNRSVGCCERCALLIHLREFVEGKKP